MTEARSSRPASDQWTILVVEDQRFVRTMIVHMLNGLGIKQILEADDGSEAIHQLQSRKARAAARQVDYDLSPQPKKISDSVDCIISDINMRPMNGLELLKAIRLGDAGIERHVPVVMLTGLSDEKFLSAALALDANGFAIKPISANSLADRIQRVVSIRHPVKAAKDYAAVAVPDIDDADSGGSAASPQRAGLPLSLGFDLGSEEPSSLRAVQWTELQEGDVLQDNFCTTAGTVVVPEGTKISPALLSALRDLSEIVTLRAQVTIVRAVQR